MGLIPESGKSSGVGHGHPLHYSCLENSMDTEAWWATVHVVAKSRTRLNGFTFTVFHFTWLIARHWHPIPVLLPRKSHGRRSLVGCSPWGCEELDTTERLPFHCPLSCIGEENGNPRQCMKVKSEKSKWNWSRSVVSNSSQPHRLQPTRLLYLWDFLGKSTGVGCWTFKTICFYLPIAFFVLLWSYILLLHTL